MGDDERVARVDSLLAQMTVEEKVHEMQAPWKSAPADEPPGFVVGPAPGNDRLGIPALAPGEGLHGVMVWPGQDCTPTVFPQAIALASSWDPGLLEQVATAVAREARALGIHHCYTPVLDVACDPRFGRIEETYGEDPLVVERMGTAYIHGLQGRGHERFDGHHVLATAKHFVAYHEGERGINGGPVDISERRLRELHFPPFRAAVAAGVSAVMPSHTDLNGLPCHADRWLLTDVLRGEWGFEGLVVSDNRDITRLREMHAIAADEEEAARLALEAGVDQEISLQHSNVRCYGEPLVEAVRAGRIDSALLDRSARRVLEAKAKLGLLDDEAPATPCASVVLCDEHRSLALDAARRCAVLLHNDGTLPLDPSRVGRIAVVGPNADRSALGGYAGWTRLHGVTVLEGLRARDDGTEISHARGCPITGTSTDGFAEAVAAAQAADVALVVLGDSEETVGEGVDRSDLRLPGVQQELLEAVHATGTPTVLVLLNGRPPDLSWAAEHVAAILECWYLGVESGTAIADLLWGETNPGGKLTVTFPRSVGHLPQTYREKHHFTGSGGGRYVDADRSPLYPFGHGLSYTTFEHGEPRIDRPTIATDGSTTVRATVRNSGLREGAEVLQLYVRDDVASVTRPLRVLRDWRRVVLGPGDAVEVAFAVDTTTLSLLDRELRPVVEPGTFTLMVGPSSAHTRSVCLTVTGDEPLVLPG